MDDFSSYPSRYRNFQDSLFRAFRLALPFFVGNFCPLSQLLCWAAEAVANANPLGPIFEEDWAIPKMARLYSLG
jgi:hypothetical protein